jgi:Chaperone of endosialidase
MTGFRSYISLYHCGVESKRGRICAMKANTLSSVLFALLAYFALSPRMEAVVPPPDGGYPNFTTAEGQNALKHLTTGAGNTAVGWYSLFSATTASFNTGVGAGTLALNTGDHNTATGTAALLLNSTGISNTAFGSITLLNNNTGANNTGVGAGALTSNTTGNANTAMGVGTLGSNTDGGGNTATGTLALSANSGDLNTATGLAALQNNTTGGHNTAIGAGALNFNSSGSFNIALGVHAGENVIGGSNNIYIGDLGDSTESNTIGIGARSATGTAYTQCFIGGIFGQPGGANDVFVSSTGKLGFFPSSRRYKDEIKPMDKTSEVIYALKPVSFRYKAEIEPMRPVSFGLIAEDVEEVNPDLVTRGDDGKINSVRYQAVNAMLLNEFLKEHRKNEEQQAVIARLIATDTRQQEQIEALTAALQKVSAQIEASKPAPQVVSNP